MSCMLQHFDVLTDLGLKVIPLKEGTKKPMCRGWTDGWDHGGMRERIVRYPQSNIGLLLGDIVDVEGDSEQANRKVAELIGDYPHPCYTSTKSVHHLFLTPDPELRHFRVGSIEFRGHGHQSVLPPSSNAGVQYRWLVPPTCGVPEMPPRLADFFRSKKRCRKKTVKPGHTRAECGVCGRKEFIHGKRLDLEVRAMKIAGQPWACHGCRTIDLRPACRMLRGGAPDRVVAGIL